MREAIGATWIFGIVLTFITLFSGYLAFSVNYSNAFKVKDGIIERLEKYSGPNTESLNDIADYLKDVGYTTTGMCDEEKGISDGAPFIGVTTNVPSNKNPDNGKYNYCIQRITSYNNTGQLSAAYYKVVVFFSLSLPVVGNSFSFSVSGETMNIYYPYDMYLG